jgi:DNA-binding MarR family transcriptional regulator
MGKVVEFMRLLWAIGHGLQATSKRMERSLGVTGPQRLAIRIVGRLPGTTPGDLARILHLDPSTLTGVLKRLEAHGILQRRRDPSDGRRARLSLTGRGRQRDVRTTGTVEAAVTRVLRRLPAWKIRVVQGVLAEVAGALDEGKVAGRRERAARGSREPGGRRRRGSGGRESS